MTERHALRTIAAAISDGATVDWAAAESVASSPADRAILHELKAIAALASAGGPRAAERPAHRVGSTWLLTPLLGIAGVKVLLGAAGWYLLLESGRAGPSAHIVNLVVFAAAAAALWAGGRDDDRARRLGALFLLIASAFSDRLLLGVARYEVVLPLTTALRGFPADVFIAFALWRFVWAFPQPPIRTGDERVVRWFLRASLASACLLLAATAALAFAGSLPRAAKLAAAFDPTSPASYYSLLLFGIAAPALPCLLWKSRFDARDERRRAVLFAGALVAGITPMLVAVLISPFVGFFDRPANRELVGIFLYACLLSIVPVTAYSVLVHRVIDVGLLVTRQRRHALARNAVSAVRLAPLGFLALYVYTHRGLTVTDMVSGQGSFVFLIAAAASLAAAGLSGPARRAIDRRFLGAPPDYPDMLARLDRDFRGASGVRDVAAVLERAAERAVQPAVCAVFLLDVTGKALTSPTAALSPLRTQSTLGRLLRLAREEIHVGGEAAGPVGSLLPEEDRSWLTGQGFELLVPMDASGGDLLGMMALGQRRGGLHFSKDDRQLLVTMASQAAVVIGDRCFRDVPYRHLASGSRQAGTIDWDDEPGALCPACRTVLPSGTASCTCGTVPITAALPMMVRGKFRVLRLIGSGGMGVVYLAIDVALNRRVAIKTLPRLTPALVARLQREARAMAAVPHPNLALIFGVESWRGAPLLVVEYLEAGTLADRQPGERLTPDEAAALGIALADVLDSIHAAGLTHRDIKPSNIGYTRDGAPKLLDFGIARMLEPEPQPGRNSEGARADAPEPVTNAVFDSSLTDVDHVACTPLYLCPEALAGAEPGAAFDLWSLCMVLYEAIAGVHPFRDATAEGVFDRIRHADIPDIRTFREDAPPLLAAFFARALDRDPARRARSAAELRNWLHRLRAELRHATA